MHILFFYISYTDIDIYQFFHKKDLDVSVDYLPITPSLNIRSIFSGEGDKDTLIIFVHGAPGSWDNFKTYMTDSRLAKMADFIAYDRPGYGGSYNDHAYPSLHSQALAIKAIVDRYRYDHYVLVGHSYGGPVITKFALEYPSIDCSLVLIAPAIDPDAEKYWWFSPIGKWNCTKWLIPSDLSVSAIEKYAHEDELKELTTTIPLLQVSTILVHSIDDALAPAIGNINFVWKKFPTKIQESYIFTDQGHLILWNDSDAILSIIRKVFQN